MPRLKHELVLKDLDKYLYQSKKLASDSRLWVIAKNSITRPRFTTFHHHILIELAFLRSYLAWERFLEEAFILYLIGKKPQRRRRSLKRLATPKSYDHAMQLILLETKRSYVDWDNPQTVDERARKWFLDGEPFVSALRNRQNQLNEIKTLRNAIAHRSIASQSNFQRLVRDKLMFLPQNLSVGGFLEKNVPGVLPPITFLDNYLEAMNRTARVIIP